jgi:hypothetical protein
MPAIGKPVPFEPSASATYDARAAEALEFIAARMAAIEFELAELRLRMAQVPEILGRLLTKP